MSDITIGRLRGGFCVYWTDPETGKRKRYQLASSTLAEAQAEGRDRFLKETAAAGPLTVSDLWEKYRVHLGNKPSAKTMGYTGIAVKAFFGALRPDQITVEDCRAYKDHRLSEGKSVNTVWSELTHLRSTCNWAEKMGLIKRAPHIELPPKPDSDVKPVSDEDIARLLDACHAPHIRLAVQLLLTTGARVSAILDLEWNRVDFDQGVIDLRLPDGVTRKGRAVVPMNRTARAALIDAEQARLTGRVIEHNGKPVKSIKTGFAAAKRRAGIDKLPIHQLRHTVAIRMLGAGIAIEKVSQFLGHSNLATTYRIYGRFIPSQMQDAAEVVEFPALRKVSG